MVPVSDQTSRLASCKRWHMQLQNYAGFVEAHRQDEGTLLVIDYSRDGTQRGAFTASEVRTLKNGGKNRVLAYLSIGEAEAVRWYFARLPARLKGAANPEFTDNFFVPYWDAQWQRTVALGPRSSLERIQDAGFDGVYLDIVDGYQRYPKRRAAAAEMVRFVQAIARKARARDADFAIVPQNATCLSREAGVSRAQAAAYFAAIDATGVESTFFLGSAIEDNPLAPQKEVLECLGDFRARGKPIFALEYVSKPELQAQARAKFGEHGIIGTMTDRMLTGKFIAR